MSLYFFKFQVLERYLNDPRYDVGFYDFGGSIRVQETYTGSTPLEEQDRISLRSFGLAYSADRTRGLGVFLVRLDQLTPSHQRHWQLYQVESGYKIVADYFRTSIEGKPPEHISIYQALLLEQVTINDMALSIGKPKLFRRTYQEFQDRPKELSVFVRPTRANYSAFVHVLDKITSDNMNKEFFKGDIPLTRDIRRRDGKVEVQQSGTVVLLESWLDLRFPYSTDYIEEEIIRPLKDIRKLRQRPAHGLSDDEYDENYYDLQARLISTTYGSVASLRQLISTFPELAGFSTPAWMNEDRVVVY